MKNIDHLSDDEWAKTFYISGVSSLVGSQPSSPKPDAAVRTRGEDGAAGAAAAGGIRIGCGSAGVAQRRTAGGTAGQDI